MRTRITRSLALVLVLLSVVSSRAVAQSLPDTTLTMKERWDVQGAAGLDFVQGAYTSLRLASDQMVRFAGSRQRLELAGSQAIGSSDARRYLRDLRGFGRYRVSVLSRSRVWLPEVSMAALAFYERSEPQRHELLTQTGLAADLTIVRTPGARLSVTAGYVFEREVFSQLTREDLPTAEVRDSRLPIWAHRGVFGIELGFEPRAWLHVGQRTFGFVPLAHCACDTKVEGSLFLRLLAPASPLAMQFEAGALYDPRPALRATQLRTLARTSFVLHFR